MRYGRAVPSHIGLMRSMRRCLRRWRSRSGGRKNEPPRRVGWQCPFRVHQLGAHVRAAGLSVAGQPIDRGERGNRKDFCDCQLVSSARARPWRRRGLQPAARTCRDFGRELHGRIHPGVARSHSPAPGASRSMFPGRRDARPCLARVARPVHVSSVVDVCGTIASRSAIDGRSRYHHDPWFLPAHAERARL